MAPLQRTCAIFTTGLSSLRNPARTSTALGSLCSQFSGYGSPVSTRWSQYSSFCPYLSQGLPFPNRILNPIWIGNDHKRLFSVSAANTVGTDEKKISIGPSKSDDKDNHFVYYGPISDTIRRVKLLSLSTCCLSVSLGPAITFLTSPDLNVIVKGAVASSVIFFSASTTAILHWFVSPYVHKLKWQPGSDSFEVEVLSWLATYLPRTIQFSDIKPPDTNRPYVTFQAKGDYYYIDTERLKNKALLARLIPRRPTKASTLKNL